MTRFRRWSASAYLLSWVRSKKTGPGISKVKINYSARTPAVINETGRWIEPSKINRTLKWLINSSQVGTCIKWSPNCVTHKIISPALFNQILKYLWKWTFMKTWWLKCKHKKFKLKIISSWKVSDISRGVGLNFQIQF